MCRLSPKLALPRLHRQQKTGSPDSKGDVGGEQTLIQSTLQECPYKDRNSTVLLIDQETTMLCNPQWLPIACEIIFTILLCLFCFRNRVSSLTRADLGLLC